MEYIEREDAEKKLAEVFAKRGTFAELLTEIHFIPAADVVPVVRCGECKHSAVDFENMRYCKLVTYYNHVPDDWFCADGERKDGDGE